MIQLEKNSPDHRSLAMHLKQELIKGKDYRLIPIADILDITE